MKRRAEHISWVDSGSHQGWLSADQIPMVPLMCESIGFVVAESASVVVLAVSRIDEALTTKPFCQAFSIPKCAITKRQKVKL